MKLFVLVYFLQAYAQNTLGICSTSFYPPDRRVVRSSVAVKAVVTEKTQTTAELWILYVYKGGDKLSVYLGLPSTHLYDVSMQDIRVSVDLDDVCANTVQLHSKQEFIVLLKYHNGKLNLDPNPGAIIPYSSNLDKRIYNLLGWEQWADWTQCSSSCGGGEQRKTRICRTRLCTGHSVETRGCNNFPCKGALDLFSVQKSQYYKPDKHSFKKIPGRLAGWRLKAGSYLLYPFQEVFRTIFPSVFSVFLVFKPFTHSEGVLLSLTNPQKKDEFISFELSTISGGKTLEVKIVHSTVNGTRVVGVPAEILYNKWNNLALSIGEDTTIKSYLNCRWLSTQILHGYPIQPATFPDVAIGYMFQGEIEQVIVSRNPEDVSDECTAEKPKHETHTTEDKDYLDEDYLDEEVVELERRGNDEEKTKRGMKYDNPKKSEEELSGEEGEGSGQDDDDMESSGDNTYGLEWSSWTSCSSTCGRATQTRVSRCLDSERMMDCIGEGLERKVTRACSLPPCRVETSAYSPFKPESHITNEDIQLFNNRFRTSSAQANETYSVKQENPALSCGCGNNGHCTANSSCECNDGWTGPDCSTPICTPNCEQGKCVQPDVCGCNSGYTGARCKTAFCHPACQNGGGCSAPFICTCAPGFTGNFCQKSLCQKSCKNGGTCIRENMCACLHGFSGVDCGDTTCTRKCRNGGVCTSANKCTCQAGFYGELCQKRICEKYSKVKEPVRQAYKRVVTVSSVVAPLVPVYKTFYRTTYRTTLRCIDPVLH
ncbi:protein kinase C-binding protein NELL2 [Eurytemora carolleeae]|uniref:protein kinase C-binding protein NELL2 n=1 Tax=Eurytemora carolleeae TaxID=1294199 RepID=UPI000C7608D1|nr:protein kinase C-binding protein NELL2 [Eurytemora carolleeae]|eukprot:XP_023337431.1 protein kinase C-binding protein NELL2-like [Eurytemora affinis]